MKSSLLSFPRFTRTLIVGFACLECTFGSAIAQQTFGNYADAVTGSYFFKEPIYWVGDRRPDEGESRMLLEILDGWRDSHRQIGLSDLEMYLEAYTNSAWAPSLHANLGKYYRDLGRYTLALEHWQQAWEMSQHYPEGAGKIVADYTFAHWTRLLASLGRYEALEFLFNETKDRFIDPSVNTMVRRTREAFVDMGQHPWHSYRCGVAAIYHVAQALELSYDVRSLGQVGSPADGLSMRSLVAICGQLNLPLEAVIRLSDNQIVVPSVVHWNQEHYAAIVAQSGDLYKVVDPTFGHPQWFTAEAINAEASGIFLIPASRIPSRWRLLGAAEQDLIVGKGNPNFLGDADNQPTCPRPPGTGGDDNQTVGGNGGPGDGGGNGKDGSDASAPGGSGDGPHILGGANGGRSGGQGRPGPQMSSPGVTIGDASARTRSSFDSCQGCGRGGMPTWRVDEPYINLWISDEPLGYQPALGPRVSFALAYKQNDEFSGDMSVFNFGADWHSDWLSYVSTATPLLSADVQLPNGGRSYFDLHNGWGTNYYNNFRLHAITNGSGTVTSYEVLKPDGSKIVYGFFRTDTGGGWDQVFMTQDVDPFGNALTFQYPNYDSNTMTVKLKYIVDGDGRTNTVSYLSDDIYYKNRVGSVTDPFGRTASLGIAGYSSGLGNVLTNITDVASLSSSFTYSSSLPATMVTPYGTTSFSIFDPYPYFWDRSIIITEPNGGRQIYASAYYCETTGTAQYQAPFSASQIPTNTPVGTFDTNASYRNTFYWGRAQAATMPADIVDFTATDYLKGRMRHWLGGADEPDNKPEDTLAIERAFSPDGGATPGQVTWYDYANKGPHGNDDKGTQIMPSVIAQVLPDGSTRYMYFQRNSWGIPTSMTSTYTTTSGTIGTRTESYGYSSDGRDQLTITNASGVQVSSNYFNAYHQILTNYNALNEATIYTYNANHQLSGVRFPSGLTRTNIFFSGGSYPNWLDKTIDIEITRTNSFTWSSGVLQTQTDERGLTRTFTWDNLQRQTGITFPDGSVSSNKYSRLDLISSRDRLGNWSNFGYDSLGRLIAATNALGNVTTYGYCDCGALSYLTNALGQVTQYVYDYQGRPVIKIFPDTTTTQTNWYNSLGQLTARGDAGAVTWFGYNNQGLRTSVTNGVGVAQRTVFNIEDQAYIVTDANSVNLTNTFDSLGRLRTRTYSDGGVEAFGYTAMGLFKYTNQLNLVTSYGYDAASRKTSKTNANSEVISYTYSPAGDLRTLADGKNQVTTWNYDLYGRVTNKLDQASVEILRYQYDANSRLTNRWSKSMGNTAYLYDSVANVTKIDYPAGTTDITYSYDALNRLTNMVDAAGTTKFTYNANGQLLTEDGPLSSDTVTYSYNSGRLRSSLSLQQSTGTWTNGFTYDSARRLSTVNFSGGTVTYTYQTPGLLVKKIALPNTSYITNTFDSVGRMTSTLLNNSSHTTLDKMDYLHNPGNQCIRLTRTDASYYTNTYDNIGQLRWADSTVATEDRGYLYDAAWNLSQRTNNGTLQTFTVDGKNQLTNAIGTTCVYDLNGNMTTNGSVVFTYDAENQLVQAISGTSWRTDFTYDGLGRLRKRVELAFSGGGWSTSTDTRYVYDGMRVIQERPGATGASVAYTRGVDLSGTIEGAGGIGGLLARSSGYSSGTGAWSTHNFYHSDGRGNVTYIVDTNQTVAAAYRYDPYGRTISLSGTSVANANVYRFSSKEIHLNSGMYYFGYRFYDPNLQRWLNRDPIEEWGGINLYRFVRNRPTDLVDALGKMAITIGPITIYIPFTNDSDSESGAEEAHEGQHRADWLSGLPGWKKEQRGFAAEIPFLKQRIDECKQLLPYINPKHPIHDYLENELAAAENLLGTAEAMAGSDFAAKYYWNHTGRRWYQKPVPEE